MAVRVLVVCTANVCRSPSVAAILQARLGRDVEVVSAGSQAAVGAPACPVARDWAVRSAGPGAAQDVADRLIAHRATQLTIEAVRGADLVLTMTAQHRSAVVELLPVAQRVTFPIRYAARVAPALDQFRPADGGPRVTWLAEALHASRATTAPASEADLTVPDPHLDRVNHDKAFRLLEGALAPVLGALRG